MKHKIGDKIVLVAPTEKGTSTHAEGAAKENTASPAVVQCMDPAISHNFCRQFPFSLGRFLVILDD